jgi:hypothetical protein
MTDVFPGVAIGHWLVLAVNGRRAGCRCRCGAIREIKIYFRTAWDSPLPIFDALAERYPALTIKVEYSDWMAGFGGEVHCHAGQVRHVDCSEEIRAEFERAMNAACEQD